MIEFCPLYFHRALGDLALLLLPFGLDLCGCGKSKCAKCAVAKEFENILCVGKKIKTQKVRQ